ncbi:Fe-S cluster assembly protein SufD [Alkaliphilus transvaalensis]|uniref:Fe-S cluster assembly protein SufD n=1 Tax=Alkaliphilus transvaalensis TaxID=114628 RepID=UPI0006868D89|nr:Fe-S cluster assembly protein SufD [Alkaliphilus transvaalensis]
MYNLEMINTIKNYPDWVKEYRKEKLKNFNEASIPSWKRINIGEITLPEYRDYYKSFIKPTKKQEGVYIEETIKGLNDFNNFNKLNNLNNLNKYLSVEESYGVSDKFVAFGEALFNSGFLIKIDRKTKAEEIIKMKYTLDEANPLVIDHNIIVGEEDSEVTVVIDYSSDDGGNSQVFHNGITKVFAKDGAKINIIKIQRLNNKAINLDSNITFIGRDAQVNWVLIDIGGEINVVNYISNLEGVESQSNLKSIYLGDGESKQDLSYTMNHKGMRSLSKIEARGALKDNAKKVFRGNLDFKKGSRRSKGDEAEYVLLLDKNVRSHSIPVLFSHEDDVEGNHAASAGQIDANQLFYLMSRGLKEKEAKKLIVEASFSHILDDIPDLELREVVDAEIHRRLVYV